MKLSDIKGLKEKRIQKLNEAGIYRPEDLILHFPYKYFDVDAVPQFVDGEDVMFFGEVCAIPKRQFVRKGLSMVKARLKAEDAIVTATWFNQPYIIKLLNVGKKVLLSARVKRRGTQIELSAPILYKPELVEANSKIIPIYRPIKGLPYTVLVEAIKTVLLNTKIDGYLTSDICEKFSLVSLNNAIRSLHFPISLEEVKKASKSIAIENLSYTISVFNLSRSLENGKRAYFYDNNLDKLFDFINTLPFELSEDQLKTINTITKEFHSYQRINRLVQGDVGCGKTIIAFLAMYYAALSGFQSVLMAPTEILAYQHYKNALKIFENSGINIEFLSGSQTKQNREASLFNIKHGNASIVIGTHALISETVEFNRLSLVITDEQQRFGVTQRALLENKTMQADSIVMTATPIPRTLGLTLYGDLNQSIIKSMPKNRPKIFTHLIKEHKLEDMFSYIKTCADKNLLTYIVCPRIDDEDEQLTSVNQMYDKLKNRFDEGIVGHLHGRMKERDKNRTMEAFANEKIKILLSTTVVEVGIDVKNAVNMVIFDPQRYGLSQLHQLRGRIGRGTMDSHCFLIDIDLPIDAKKRLEFFVRCEDGFSLAEYDFQNRGAGDFLGTRQHGEAVSLVGEKLTSELISQAKALSDTLLSYSFIREEILKNIDTNRIEYIKNITLN